METKQIKLSSCCREEARYSARGVYIGNGRKVPHMCSKCRNGCAVVMVCELCLGTGEVDTDETDSDGNTARGVGTQKCLCQLSEDSGADHDQDR